MAAARGPRVAIVGLGTMGSMAAWQLAERGAEVTVFEAFWPGHNEGAAGGGTRMFRRVYAEGPEYAGLVETAWHLWRALERRTGEDILFRTGGLSIGPIGHPVVAGAIAYGEQQGVPFEILDGAELVARYPQHIPFDGEVALFDPEAGVLRSNVAVASAAAAASALGAVFRLGQRVTGVEEAPGGAVVVTDDGRFAFDHVIVAGGPWASALLPGLPLETRAVFHTWHLVTDKQLLRPERHPIALRRSGEDLSYGTMSALDGTRIKLAPHFEYPRHVDDVAELDRHVRHEWQRRSIALAEKLFTGIVPGPVEAGIFPESFTPDGHPAIGTMDADARIVVMAGFSGHGFKLAPAFGRAAAEIVANGSSPLIPKEAELHRDFAAQRSIRDLVLASEPS